MWNARGGSRSFPARSCSCWFSRSTCSATGCATGSTPAQDQDEATMRFQGQGVIVTGAAGVFGRWISAAFAREGARLCLSDMRRDAIEALASELKLDPAHTILHATELTEEASIVELAGLVKSAWGAPDVLVNNAGIYPH